MSKLLKLTATLASFAGFTKDAPKVASAAQLREDIPNIDPKLQALVGDPNRGGLSMFSQTSPDVGENQQASPLSPIEGDDIFFTGMIPGARFKDHSGQWWDIEDYDFEGKVRISNPWYPRKTGVVSLQDIRRSIYAWMEPFTQVVPPPPVGVDYDVLNVRQVK